MGDANLTGNKMCAVYAPVPADTNIQNYQEPKPSETWCDVYACLLWLEEKTLSVR